jgi:hypothetical protein
MTYDNEFERTVIHPGAQPGAHGNGAPSCAVGFVAGRSISRSTHSIAAAVLAFSVSACGTAPGIIGSWEQGERTSHFHLVLAADGTCALAAGNEIDAFGGCCRYSVSGNTVKITEIEGRDGFLPAPPGVALEFLYSSDKDSLSSRSNKAIIFHRADVAGSQGMTLEQTMAHCGRSVAPR